jgi:Na+-translocating ferredoxin:NAD+ oxidoreductase RNF subunit RnfB
MIQSYKWLPVVDEDICTRCGLCVEACGPGCLEIIDDVARLSCAEACGSEEHCIPVCAEGAIRMQWLPMKGARTNGKWRFADWRARF